MVKGGGRISQSFPLRNTSTLPTSTTRLFSRSVRLDTEYRGRASPPPAVPPPISFTFVLDKLRWKFAPVFDSGGFGQRF